MPFTASHAAIVFPFLRTPLLPAGLVIGAMAPDLLYFLPFDTYRDLTHTPPGVVTIDLGIGIVLLALWWSLLRAPVIDLAPTWLSERMSRPAPARQVRGFRGVGCCIHRSGIDNASRLGLVHASGRGR